MKQLTFSYDDGVVQDIRLVELFERYGIKATFNLNSELLGTAQGGWPHVKNEDVRSIYAGHEIAVHTLTHPLLPQIPDDNEIIRQVEEDRMNLSELVGYEVIGMAYPCGGENHDERVINLINDYTGVKYARTIQSSHLFDKPKRLLEYNPTVYHREMNRLFELGEQFLKLPKESEAKFYVWGHSYEFDRDNTWEWFEEFLQMMSGRKDIEYCTNRKMLLNETI